MMETESFTAFHKVESSRVMLVGYARVSTPEQKLDPQIDALVRAGCKKIYSDVASGSRANRPGLTDALEVLRPHDTLVVWKLDRVGRSLKHLIELVGYLEERNVELRSLLDPFDTARNGQAIFHVFGVLAQFERDLVRDRTQVGLKAARARGRKGGRPRALDEKKLALARQLYKEGRVAPRDICRQLGISKATLYRYVSTRKKKPAADIGTSEDAAETTSPEAAPHASPSAPPDASPENTEAAAIPHGPGETAGAVAPASQATSLRSAPVDTEVSARQHDKSRRSPLPRPSKQPKS